MSGIAVDGLTRRFGAVAAVTELSFTARPGRVTGFLGPNGAGKTTTLRILLGLEHADAGTARIDGRRYRDLRHPLRHVGALLDARWTHPHRTARAHLRWLAASNGLDHKRVDEVLEQVGLSGVRHRRPAGFSLGMAQRLGLATALLGDPSVVLLDEPVNGLDPEGVRWIRRLMRRLAADGRTVLVSSHLLAEMVNTADDLVVIGRGRLLAQCTVDELIDKAAVATVRVRCADAGRFANALRHRGLRVETDGDGLLVHTGDAALVGHVAADNAVVLHELTPRRGSLEDVFLRLTSGAVEFHGMEARR
ncbi:ATP-binding cassette domain-containing protein [Fodinicola acaciae]|uniref:ATP-binding cassette domain-containing protein n=1 Tax=Fodinicola acaciae TaxID=2681555 RepID=UPI001C9E4152|nr:ATP-binding cassette domain-containing protein [Fodinicola acaciae]